MRWRRLCEIFFFVFFLSNADALHADINRLHQECFYLIAIRAQEADEKNPLQPRPSDVAASIFLPGV